jgi:sortase A
MRVTITAWPWGKPAERLLRATRYVFLAAGIMALGYAGYAVLDRYSYQEAETSKFEMPGVPAASPTIEAVHIADGGVIGEITVARLKLKAIVVQGDSEDLLRRAVGHLAETPLPSEPGNVALAGHRDGLFRPLRGILPGDIITLATTDREYEYEVQWTSVVPPNAVRVLQSTDEPTLTLITCFPFYYVGAAPERFIVRARRISTTSRALRTH